MHQHHREHCLRRLSTLQVDLDDVKVAQEAALANVMSAVESGLASVPAKRQSDAAPLPAKRQRASGHMLDLDGDLSSDSDDEVDDAQPGPSDANEIAAEAQAQPIEKADIPSGSNSSGSDQEALGSSLPPMHPAQVCWHTFCRRMPPCSCCMHLSGYVHLTHLQLPLQPRRTF